VNVTALLGPPGVVTVTVLADSAALAAMVKLALTVVAFTTVMPVTVILPPETVTAVVPVRLVPVRVTGTTVPGSPVAGVIDVRVGAAGATPVPERETGEPVTVTLPVIVSVAFTVVPAVGEKTTLMVQVAPKAKVAVHVPPAAPAGRE